MDLFGRAVPVVRTDDGLRAVSKGKPGNPAQIERYLAGKFGERLGDARQAMAVLAAAHEPADLYRLYGGGPIPQFYQAEAVEQPPATAAKCRVSACATTATC